MSFSNNKNQKISKKSTQQVLGILEVMVNGAADLNEITFDKVIEFYKNTHQEEEKMLLRDTLSYEDFNISHFTCRMIASCSETIEISKFVTITC